MGLLADINKYITEFLVILLLVGLVVGGLLWYFLKIKKVRAKTEVIDYDSFDRINSLDYVKFDHIVSGGIDGEHNDMGMIVTNNGNRFVAILSVMGFNFSSASAEERMTSMKGFQAFLNTLKDSVQYRQSTTAVDLSESINVHQKMLEKVAEKIMSLDADYKEIQAAAEKYINQPEIYKAYATKLDKIQRDITTETWQKSELEIEIEYMNSISGQGSDSNRVETYIIDWKYDPTAYTEELTKDQIYIKAISELSSKASTMISSLARCNCTAKLLSATEITDLFRHHYSPLTADDTKIDEMLGSNYNSLFITSDSLIDTEKEMIGEEEWKRQITEEAVRQAEARTRREKDLAMFEEALVEQSDNIDYDDYEEEAS